MNDEWVPIYVEVKVAAALVYGNGFLLYLGIPLFSIRERSVRIGYWGPFPIQLLLR